MLPILFIIITFVIGYVCITLEHTTRINKSAIALLMGVVCWVFAFLTDFCQEQVKTACFIEHLGAISQVIFFLLGALIIVEVINVHHGFRVISEQIQIHSKQKLLWVLGLITFFLSAILDNLTTTIVMITLLGKLAQKTEDRLIIGGGIVIAANAGGAWTPIGDVTTTMLWIGGQITSSQVMIQLFLPSFISLLAGLFILSFSLKGSFPILEAKQSEKKEPYGTQMFFLGMGALISVPIFKSVTGLPPFMGVLFGLSLLWFVTDVLHRSHSERSHLKMGTALSRIDLSSTLFFLGILLAIDALDVTNILDSLAHWLDHYVGSDLWIPIIIGLVSAVVDNVPLVAAAMGMYDLSTFSVDSRFWQLVAFCAGTGGSILVIGSAAGVVYMGLEKVDFLWYVRRISLSAIIAYAIGIATYLLLWG